MVRGHFPLCRDDLTIQPVQFSPQEDLGLFELGFLLVHLPEQMHKTNLSDPLCQFGVFFLDLVEMLENDPDIRMIIDLVGHFTFERLTGLRLRPVSSEELLVLAQLVLEMSTDLTLDVSSGPGVEFHRLAPPEYVARCRLDFWSQKRLDVVGPVLFVQGANDPCFGLKADRDRHLDVETVCGEGTHVDRQDLLAKVVRRQRVPGKEQLQTFLIHIVDICAAQQPAVQNALMARWDRDENPGRQVGQHEEDEEDEDNQTGRVVPQGPS